MTSESHLHTNHLHAQSSDNVDPRNTHFVLSSCIDIVWYAVQSASGSEYYSWPITFFTGSLLYWPTQEMMEVKMETSLFSGCSLFLSPLQPAPVFCWFFNKSWESSYVEFHYVTCSARFNPGDILEALQNLLCKSSGRSTNVELLPLFLVLKRPLGIEYMIVQLLIITFSKDWGWSCIQGSITLF